MSRLPGLLAILGPAVATAQPRPSPTPWPPQYAATDLALRASPSDTARVISTIPGGTVLKVRECSYGDGSWCSVLHAGDSGYVAAAYVTYTGPVVGLTGTRRRATGSRNSSGQSVGGSSRRASSSGYYWGPRGGCYTYTASGRKRYVDHSYCR